MRALPGGSRPQVPGVCGPGCAAMAHEESWAAALQRRGLYLAILASFYAVLFCCWMTGNPGAFSVDVNQLGWETATCNVLAAGVDYRGTCFLDEGRYDITRGNYSECSAFVWCANEGGTCNCDGTVRYGAPRETLLASNSVELQVQGSIRCTTEAFKQDPALFRAKQCLCRPTALEMVTPQALLPSACKSVEGYTDWVNPPAAGDCSRLYVPWALVAVQKDGSKALGPPPTRCAYGYGLAQVSLVEDPVAAKSDLAELKPGSDIPCRVLVRKGGKDGEDLGDLEDCVIALKPPDSGLTARWAGAWQQKVHSRYTWGWFIMGLGFLFVLVSLLLQLRTAEAREMPAEERLYLRMAC